MTVAVGGAALFFVSKPVKTRGYRSKVGTQRAEVASALPVSFAITLPRNSSSAAGHLGFIRLDGSAASVARS